MTGPSPRPTREQVEAQVEFLRDQAQRADAMPSLTILNPGLAARTPQPAEPLPWLTGAAPDETARVVADVKAEAVWLVLHMQANGTREDIQSALRTLRLVWGDPPPVDQQAAAAVALQPTIPDGPHLDELHRALVRRIGNLRKGGRKLVEISSARNDAHRAVLDERDQLRNDLDEAGRIGADVARQRAELLRQIERSAPAVPDGEDAGRPHLVDAAAPAMRKLMRRVSSRQMGADDAVDVLLGWPNRAVLDEEDVPARVATTTRREPCDCGHARREHQSHEDGDGDCEIEDCDCAVYEARGWE